MKVTRKLLPIYLVIFFGYIGYSLIITIFTPMFLYPDHGVLPAHTSEKVRILALGFIIFLYPFGQFLSSPILGALSDRFGRRPILVFSLFVSTIVYAIVGLGVIIESFWLIASALLAAGLSEGNITIAQSTIADLSPKKERSRFFGYIYFSASLSYIIGPLIGGKLANPKIYSGFSFHTPFFVVSILLFVTLCWVYFGFKETLGAHHRVKIPYFEAFTNLKNLFRFRRVRFLFSINAVLYLSIFGFFQSFPIYIVSRFDVQIGMLSLFIAWTSIPFIIVNLWLTGLFAKRFSPTQVTAASAVLVGIFLEIMLIPPQQNALWLTLFLVGFAVATCLPASSAVLSSAAEEREQGRVMGLNQSLQFLAEAVSGLAVGFLAAIFVKLSLIIFGLLSFVGAIMLVLWERKNLPSSRS